MVQNPNLDFLKLQITPSALRERVTVKDSTSPFSNHFLLININVHNVLHYLAYFLYIESSLLCLR